jgi:hypothetical protein
MEKSIQESLIDVFGDPKEEDKDCPCGCEGTCGCSDAKSEARTIIRRIRKMRKVKHKGTRRILR